MFLYPGRKYLGPGNPLNNGTPTTPADFVAQKHDHAYANAKYKEDIYKADKEAIDSFNKIEGFDSKVGSLGLNIKNTVEERILGKTLYPFNMAPTRSPPTKIARLNGPYSTKNNSNSNNNSSVGQPMAESTTSMDTDEGMVNDQPISISFRP